jgi:hypothetical protein
MLVVLSQCVVIVVLLISYRFSVMQLYYLQFIRASLHEKYYLTPVSELKPGNA